MIEYEFEVVHGWQREGDNQDLLEKAGRGGRRGRYGMGPPLSTRTSHQDTGGGIQVAQGWADNLVPRD